MEAQDAGLAGVLKSSYGYVILPEIGDAAFIVGGASGNGIVYRGGQPIGTVTLKQGSLGAQIGGDTYAELIVLQDDKAFNRVINNSLEFGGDLTATIVKAGAAGSATFANGVEVYILPKGGLKAGAALTGQKFHYSPYKAPANP
jgi:lipid-binding SYLF domain-containing protein